MQVLALVGESDIVRIRQGQAVTFTDVAVYATRVVRMKDGRAFSDEPVANRRDAAADLAELDRSAA